MLSKLFYSFWVQLKFLVSIVFISRVKCNFSWRLCLNVVKKKNFTSLHVGPILQFLHMFMLNESNESHICVIEILTPLSSLVQEAVYGCHMVTWIVYIKLFLNDEFQLCFKVGSMVYLSLEKPFFHFHNFILSLFSCNNLCGCIS